MLQKYAPRVIYNIFTECRIIYLTLYLNFKLRIHRKSLLINETSGRWKEFLWKMMINLWERSSLEEMRSNCWGSGVPRFSPPGFRLKEPARLAERLDSNPVQPST